MQTTSYLLQINKAFSVLSTCKIFFDSERRKQDNIFFIATSFLEAFACVYVGVRL